MARDRAAAMAERAAAVLAAGEPRYLLWTTTNTYGVGNWDGEFLYLSGVTLTVNAYPDAAALAADEAEARREMEIEAATDDGGHHPWLVGVRTGMPDAPDQFEQEALDELEKAIAAGRPCALVEIPVDAEVP